MPVATFYQPIERILEGQCEYEYYNQQTKSFSKNGKSRICHVVLPDKSDVLLMIFTIRNQPSNDNPYVWKIHSEGIMRTDPGSTVPLRNLAVKLAKEKGWKFIAIAVASLDIPLDQVVSEYVVSIESYFYGDNTVYPLTNDLEALVAADKPNFYRTHASINNKSYSLAYIKKDCLISYLTYFDDRPYGLSQLNDDSSQSDFFDKNIWGIHIKKTNNALFDDMPYVCIGWHAMGDMSVYDSKDQLANKYMTVWPNAKTMTKAQDVGQLWRFIKEMEIGDYVLFADGEYCHIGQITSDYYYDSTNKPGQDPDYVNYRDVNWIKKYINRKEVLSSALHKSLMAAMSVWSLNDYKSAVLDLLSDSYVKDEYEEYIDEESNESASAVVLCEPIAEYTTDELGTILREMYDNASIKTTAIHMFGVKYGALIQKEEYSIANIIAASGLHDSYKAEVNKGVNIFKSINDNEYGIRFLTDSKKEKATCLPVLPPRTTKGYPLNFILYGAPGTGKTYATAQYALSIVEGKKYEDVRKESRKEVMRRYNALKDAGRIVFTTFHQSFGYEDFIQGIRPDVSSGTMKFETVDGVFKDITQNALHDPDHNSYVIIIDEINRANISKVFGELITLIEEDKRWGEENAISVTLPSGDIFAVPNNLYIIGTMNSADKSISLIDTALRRRFEFIEFSPEAQLVENAELRKVMTTLNKDLLDELSSPDLLIGHYYFMRKTPKDICDIMNHSIIPLLYEYYMDDNKKVRKQVANAVEGLDVEVKGGTVGRIKLVEKNDQ